MKKHINKFKKTNYNFLKDKKMLGIMLLIIAVTMQIFAFIPIPGISTIHAYTIGMLMGWYSPFFYLYIIYIALLMIFKHAIKLPPWVKLTKVSYWFVALSIIFVSTSSGYYQSKINNGWTIIGLKPWVSFNHWFHAFVDNQSAWYPANTNGGIIGAFMFSVFSMISSGIGAFIMAIILLIFSISISITGTIIGVYKNILRKRKINLDKKEIIEIKKTDLVNINIEKEPTPSSEPFPFDDPFA